MATNQKNRPSNFVILTLKAIVAGQMQVGTNSGNPFSFVRAFLSQGKVKGTDEYKPSIFFDVKAFSQDENVSEVVQALADIQDKEYFTVKGRLGMEQWTGDDGTKRQKFIITANSIAPFSFESNGEEVADGDATELEGEPA
jgi:hypothetical protein